jgi:hypothetical protein
MPIFLILSLFSFNAFASEWSDLVKGKEYRITQDLQLSQKERSGSKLDISQGDKVRLNSAEALSAIGVTLYVFDYKNCPGPAMTTEMEIIPVQANRPVIEVGAQLETNCELHIYLENKDLKSKSLFE